MTGDKNFCYALALSEELILCIASHMWEAKLLEVDESVLDSVSEFVNIIVGNGCTRLNVKNFT